LQSELLRLEELLKQKEQNNVNLLLENQTMRAQLEAFHKETQSLRKTNSDLLEQVLI